jgi:hypothetical protein
MDYDADKEDEEILALLMLTVHREVRIRSSSLEGTRLECAQSTA